MAGHGSVYKEFPPVQLPAPRGTLEDPAAVQTSRRWSLLTVCFLALAVQLTAGLLLLSLLHWRAGLIPSTDGHSATTTVTPPQTQIPAPGSGVTPTPDPGHQTHRKANVTGKPHGIIFVLLRHHIHTKPRPLARPGHSAGPTTAPSTAGHRNHHITSRDQHRYALLRALASLRPTTRPPTAPLKSEARQLGS